MKCPIIYDPQTKIWSNPFQNVPRKICLGQRILEQLDQNDPNKIIEVNYDNGEKLTSGQLKKLVITVAQSLLNMGIKKGDIVLFYSSMNSLTTPIVFACYIIGAPICTMELALEDDDAVAVVGKLNPTIILYDEVYETRIRSTIERNNLSNLKHVLSFESRNDGKSVPQMLFATVQQNHEFEAPQLGDPDKVSACLLLTSGTTGLPKVVCLSHTIIMLGARNWWPTNSDSVIYIASPLRWISQVSAMIVPIIGNCSRAFSGQNPTPEICLDLIKTCGVTNMFAVVGLITNIFRNAEKQQNYDDLKTLRYVLTGGERITTIVDELVKSLTHNAFFTRGYGMTEIGGCIATTDFESIPCDMECGSGYIKEGFSLKIIDDNNKLLGPNQNGQICIKTTAPYLKYYKNDKANAESYTDDGEWLLTGDYGRFDDDYFLYVFNRCKDLIKCGQHVVIPSILEKHLEEHPAIEANYIIGIPDSSKGEIPVACIKLNSNASKWKTHEELKNDIKKFMESVLPSDQLPPEKIYFLENFPYTSCGKVNKIELKQWFK